MVIRFILHPEIIPHPILTDFKNNFGFYCILMIYVIILDVKEANMKRLRLVRGDFITVIFFLLIGLGGLYFNLSGRNNADLKYLRIYVENYMVQERSLTKDYEDLVTINFGPEDEHEAMIEISKGRVRMLPLDRDLCPRGICSHTGWIEHHGESIVCLPNRIMIVIHIPARSDPDYDIIAH